MPDAWLQSILATPPKICGIQLRAFSVAHAFVLRRMANPFAVGGARDFSDLYTALEICSRRFAELPALMASPPAARLLRRAGRVWAHRFETAENSFRIYIGDFLATPQRFEAGGGTPLRSPWEYYLATLLMNELGFAEGDAWDCPYARASCYAAAYAERNGDDSLVPDSESEIFGVMARANAAAESGRAAEAARLYRQVEQLTTARRAS